MDLQFCYREGREDIRHAEFLKEFLDGEKQENEKGERKISMMGQRCH